MTAVDRHRRNPQPATRIRLLPVAACLSLVIGIGMSVFWVRGYWVWDEADSRSIEPVRPGRYRYTDTAISLGSGDIVVMRGVLNGDSPEDGSLPKGWVWSRHPAPKPMGRPSWRDYWFSYHYWHSRTQAVPEEYFYDFQAVIPYWSIVFASALLPAWWAVRHFRRRRIPGSPPACARCGYDLRGGHDRCPECGARVSPSSGPAASPETRGTAADCAG